MLSKLNNKVVMKANFITVVAIECRHSFAAKLRGSLEIFVMSRTTMHPTNYGKMKLKIATDCQEVINTLRTTKLSVSFNTHLFQIRH